MQEIDSRKIVTFDFLLKMKSMNIKFIKLIVPFLFFYSILDAQQSNSNYYDYNSIVANPDVFLDKSAYNPSYCGDTLKFKASLKKMNYFIGSGDERDLSGVSVEGYFNKINSGLGFSYVYDYNFFKNHVFKLDYNYRFEFNTEFRLRIAASLGLNHYTFKDELVTFDPDPLLSSINDWGNHPLLAFGALIKFKKHELGIVYSDILNLDLNSTVWNNPDIFKNYIIINYNYRFNLSETTILTPEFIQYWNPDYDFWIFNTSASFKNRIFAGVFVRSNKEWGFMFAGRPWKKLKMGYIFTLEGFEQSITENNYGMHGINISFLIK